MNEVSGAPVAVAAHRLELFDPTGLGVYEANLRDLLQAIPGRRLEEVLGLLAEARSNLAGQGDRDAAAYETCLLVLTDYIWAGYWPLVSGSRCYLVPVWDAETLDQRQRQRNMQAVYRGMRDREAAETRQQGRLSAAAAAVAASGYDAAAVLRLVAADMCEPTLLVADTTDRRTLWNAVRMTWSMNQDRSAPGREVSMVAVDRRYSQTPLGIIQFRNVVPEIKARDTWLGLNIVRPTDEAPSAGYIGAIRRAGDPVAAMKATESTLANLLAAVETGDFDIPFEQGNESRLLELVQWERKKYHSLKRSDPEGARTHLAASKRAETAVDLLRGLTGFQHCTNATDPVAALLDNANRVACETGLRKIWHYHMGFVAIEISICGAAPPFGPLRTGKLMAALAGSEEALKSWGADRPLGQIASQVYRPSIREIVPNPGPLVLFTSGLYPGHSAQYNRVRSGRQAWKKYGDSSGYGSLHVSQATTEAMGRFNQAHDGYRHVTRAFGEGSGAKFRDIGAALSRLNLPDLRKHNVRRPLYVLPLVDDVPGVLFGWADQRPKPWSAAELWQQWKARWLQGRLDELVDAAAGEPDLETALIQRVRQIS